MIMVPVKNDVDTVKISKSNTAQCWLLDIVHFLLYSFFKQWWKKISYHYKRHNHLATDFSVMNQKGCLMMNDLYIDEFF